MARFDPTAVEPDRSRWNRCAVPTEGVNRARSFSGAMIHAGARAHDHGPVTDTRYLIVPCEGRSSDLAVIWDRLEEQVVDVIDRRHAARWTEEDALWDEGRAAIDAEPMRMAA